MISSLTALVALSLVLAAHAGADTTGPTGTSGSTGASGTSGASGASGTSGASGLYNAAFGQNVTQAVSEGDVVAVAQVTGPPGKAKGQTTVPTRVLALVDGQTVEVAGVQPFRQRPQLGTTASGAVVVRVLGCAGPSACPTPAFRPLQGGGAAIAEPKGPGGCAPGVDAYEGGRWYSAPSCKKAGHAVYVRRGSRWVRLLRTRFTVDELVVSGSKLAFIGRRGVRSVIDVVDVKTHRSRQAYSQTDDPGVDSTISLLSLTLRGGTLAWLEDQFSGDADGAEDISLERIGLKPGAKFQRDSNPPDGAFLIPGRAALTNVPASDVEPDDSGTTYPYETIGLPLTAYKPKFKTVK